MPAISSQVSPPRQFFPKTKESKELPARIPHPKNPTVFFPQKEGNKQLPPPPAKFHLGNSSRNSTQEARNFHPGTPPRTFLARKREASNF